MELAGLDGNNGKPVERMVVKSTNRSRNGSDLCLRLPRLQRAGGAGAAGGGADALPNGKSAARHMRAAPVQLVEKALVQDSNAIQLRALSLRASPQTGAAIRFL